MKKTTVLAALFTLLFLGSIATAQAGSQITFGFSFGTGPAVPYGYYYAPYPVYAPYYYPEYYSYPVIYPPYGSYVVPGYYRYTAPRVYAPRYYNAGRYRQQGRYRGNRAVRPGRWRY
jgi:hypothetical protein